MLEMLDESRDFVGRLVWGGLGGCTEGCRGGDVHCRGRLRDDNSGLSPAVRQVHQHEGLTVSGVCRWRRVTERRRVGVRDVDIERGFQHDLVVRAKEIGRALVFARLGPHPHNVEPRLRGLLPFADLIEDVVALGVGAAALSRLHDDACGAKSLRVERPALVPREWLDGSVERRQLDVELEVG